MTVDEELALSYYREISELNKEHGVTLVKNIRTNRLYVKKILTVYSLDVYRYLIEHPVADTPRIYEAIEDGGTLIVIEEYLNGTSLQTRIAEGTLPEAEAAAVTEALCRIVRDLHACVPPIVHRDIKPSNIILTDDGTVKLLDMNAAKQYMGDAEHDTQLIGTAGFAAPEQYGFGSSTVQTDIYAIGVLLAYLKYGTFSRKSLTGSPYDGIIEKCTRLDPSARYTDITELMEDLACLRAEEKDAQPKGRYIRWLPPGFRTLKPVAMILAFVIYAFIFAIGAELEVTDAVSQGEIVLNRIFFILACLAAICVAGNYMDLWDAVGISKIKSRWLRWTAAVLGGAAAFLFVVILLLIIEAIAFR